MKNMAKVFVLMVMVLLLAACATFVSNAYKSEYVSASAYFVGMQTIANLQKAGTVTADVRAKVNAKAVIFYNSYNVAVDALSTYYIAKDQPGVQEMVSTAIASMFANWADLAILINSIVPGIVPTSTMTIKGKTIEGQVYTVTVKKLDQGEISVIIQIGAAVIQFVLPELQRVINVLYQNSVSLEEIKALKTLIKPPDQY